MSIPPDPPRRCAAAAALRFEAGPGRFLGVTVSVGFASLAAGETGPELLHRASVALTPPSEMAGTA